MTERTPNQDTTLTIDLRLFWFSISTASDRAGRNIHTISIVGRNLVPVSQGLPPFFKTALDVPKRRLSSTWPWSFLDPGENRRTDDRGSTGGSRIGVSGLTRVRPWLRDYFPGLTRDFKRTTATSRPPHASPPSSRGASGVLVVARHEIGVSQPVPDIWIGLMGDEEDTSEHVSCTGSDCRQEEQYSARYQQDKCREQDPGEGTWIVSVGWAGKNLMTPSDWLPALLSTPKLAKRPCTITQRTTKHILSIQYVRGYSRESARASHPLHWPISACK